MYFDPIYKLHIIIYILSTYYRSLFTYLLLFYRQSTYDPLTFNPFVIWISSLKSIYIVSYVFVICIDFVWYVVTQKQKQWSSNCSINCLQTWFGKLCILNMYGFCLIYNFPKTRAMTFQSLHKLSSNLVQCM